MLDARAYAPVPLGRNALLGALPELTLRHLEPKFEYLALRPGRSLYEPREPLNYVFFPTSGIVSLLYLGESGASAGVTLIGAEGMVGLSPLLGAETATSRAVVEAPGTAYRLRVADAKSMFADDAQFQALILRYAHSVILELSQSAICNRHHSVEKQLCRVLLLCLDRVQGKDLQMTHEAIANLLGVRRQGITEAAKRLQERGIISYSRGRMRLLDRQALKACACECYGLLKNEPAPSAPIRV